MVSKRTRSIRICFTLGLEAASGITHRSQSVLRKAVRAASVVHGRLIKSAELHMFCIGILGSRNLCTEPLQGPQGRGEFGIHVTNERVRKVFFTPPVMPTLPYLNLCTQVPHFRVLGRPSDEMSSEQLPRKEVWCIDFVHL